MTNLLSITCVFLTFCPWAFVVSLCVFTDGVAFPCLRHYEPHPGPNDQFSSSQAEIQESPLGEWGWWGRGDSTGLIIGEKL